jgi:hypothetical protein
MGGPVIKDAEERTWSSTQSFGGDNVSSLSPSYPNPLWLASSYHPFPTFPTRVITPLDPRAIHTSLSSSSSTSYTLRLYVQASHYPTLLLSPLYHIHPPSTRFSELRTLASLYTRRSPPRSPRRFADNQLFPGLIYRMMKPKVVLLIFVSGKIVLTGAKVREEIYMAFNQIYSVLVGTSSLPFFTSPSFSLHKSSSTYSPLA